MAKSNAQKLREYRERKKSNDDKFLEKERPRQKKYYTPVDKLSKTKHKKRKEAVRARVKKFREEAKKFLKRVQELSHSSLSSNMDSSICSDSSGFVLKISFPSKDNSSKKRRLERQQRARPELQSLKNKNDQLQKRNEALRNQLQREKKKTSKSSRVDLTTLPPNSKTNALLQEHGFQPSEFPVNLRK